MEIIDQGDGTYLIGTEICKVNKNGSYYSTETGRIVANPGGGNYAITPATARDFHKRRQELSDISKLKGMIAGAVAAKKMRKEDIPDDLESLVEMAGGAESAIVAHMTEVFLRSPNLRGMAEVRKLLSIAREDKVAEKTGAELAVLSASEAAFPPQLMAVMVAVVNRNADVIEGEVSDAD